MDVRQLSALVAVAEAGTVTGAAETLNLVQPAVSRQIRSLEEELSTTLFERTSSGMTLTADGQVMLEHARRILRELERARREISAKELPLRGVVTLALPPSVADHLAQDLVARVAADHPQVRLRILVGYAGLIVSWLDSADAEMALIDDVVRPIASVEARPLTEEPLWAAWSPDHVVLPAGGLLEFARVAEYPLILPEPAHALRKMVDRAAGGLDRKLEIRAETNSMTVQRRLAMAGVGLTVLPMGAMVEEVAAGTLKAAPLDDPNLQRRLVLAVPSTRRLAPAVKVVADTLVEVTRAATTSGVSPRARWIGA